MSEITLAALLAIIFGLFWIVVWEGGRFSIKYVSTQSPLAKLYCFESNSNVLIVQSAIRNTNKTEFYRYIAPPDCVLGYHEISMQLRDARIKISRISTRFAPEINPDDMSRDMILIGGYEHNEISRQINDGERPVYLKENKIYIKGDASRCWDITEDARGNIIRDFCLISRQHSPYHDGNHWVIGFEGVRHFGTEAGVRFITPRNLRDLRALKRNIPFYIVVGCEVVYLPSGGHHLTNIRAEYMWIDGAGSSLV